MTGSGLLYQFAAQSRAPYPTDQLSCAWRMERLKDRNTVAVRQQLPTAHQAFTPLFTLGPRKSKGLALFES